MKTTKDNQLARVEQFLGNLQESESSESVILLGSEMETVGASNPKQGSKSNDSCTNNKKDNCGHINGNCANYESACGGSTNVTCKNFNRKRKPEDPAPHN